MASPSFLALLFCASYHGAWAFEVASPARRPPAGHSLGSAVGSYQGRKATFAAGTPEGIRAVVALATLVLAATTVRASRRPIVGGNWKCNPDSTSKLDGLIANIEACDTSKCDVYVCPSPLHVAYCTGKFSNGASVTPQNCNFKGCGAFTGEMAVEQMKDLGITQVLIGHSERRGEFGIFPMDNNTTLATKLNYILGTGMSCVFCIGEPLSIREKGLDAVLDEMHVQLMQIYGLLDPENVVIA